MKEARLGTAEKVACPGAELPVVVALTADVATTEAVDTGNGEKGSSMPTSAEEATEAPAARAEAAPEDQSSAVTSATPAALASLVAVAGDPSVSDAPKCGRSGSAKEAVVAGGELSAALSMAPTPVV
jgi:hypothetical protein